MAAKLRMLSPGPDSSGPGTVSVDVPIGALPAVMAVIQLAQQAALDAATPAGGASGKLLLSRPAAAAALSVSVGTLDQMIRRGDIPSLHVGGTRATRVSVADLEQYIAAEAAKSRVWARPADSRRAE